MGMAVYLYDFSFCHNGHDGFSVFYPAQCREHSLAEPMGVTEKYHCAVQAFPKAEKIIHYRALVFGVFAHSGLQLHFTLPENHFF